MDAYIFDFDGVLVNTMEAHFACYKQALEEVGIGIDKQQFYSQAGMTGREQIAYFARRDGVTVDVDAIYKRNQELKSQYIENITTIPVIIGLLKALRAAGQPTAIASGSSKQSVLPIAARFGIEVDVVVGGDDVARGKPFPDLFLLAASRLHVNPEHCIVFEDSDVGIQAAREAGMKVLRFFDNVCSVAECR
jgi:HAD superfamily hydrolase (TIGR01509 family)